jgi:signal transduction histidine kinase
MTSMNEVPKAGAEESESLRVLLVEDNAADSELVLRELKRAGFTVTSEWAQSAEEFRRIVERYTPDVVLADYNLGHWRGMDALEIMREKGLDVPLILVSGALGEVTAVECIKQGATDYVLKDALTRLPVSIRRALLERKLRAQRKQAEHALAVKAEELARSNRDLEQFAYVASHDLQEPLRMVAMYTQLLAERYRGKLDEQADKYIHYAVDGATRMQTLLQDLLAFFRAGREGSKMVRADCNLLMKQVLKNLEAAIAESRAEVVCLPLPTVMANSSQVQQVLQNLLGNAIKFRGAQAPKVEIDAKRDGNEWLFTVSDNGIGIAPEHADRIFVIFQRLHTREEYPGNGIGLSICKKIIERHGGKIWVGPGKEGGTTFHFTLPAEDNTAEETDPRERHQEDKHYEESGSLVGR